MKNTGVLLLKYAAKALLNYVSFGLAPSPVIDVIVDGGESVAKDLWDLWGSKTPEAERREAIEEIAKATPEQLRLTVEELVPEIAPEYPESEPALKALLPQIQANIRRTLRRPDDPTGTSTAGWQKFDSAHALLPLIPTKPARFMAGQRPLAGIDLELVELLGIGGFGEVWKAKNPFMPSALPVALKFCLDATAAKSLLNEAALLDRIMNQGKHPGIVKLRQTYLSAETPALQYEYIAGGDLADLIKQWYAQPTPPSVDVIRASLLELAQTMAFAHAAKIVHRDLKPANILIPVSAAIARLPKSSETSEVCAHPRFKIADFGIGGIQAEIDHRSRRAHTVGQRMAQSILGSHTPLYASPEQANGAPPHTADDVYALGVIWYQMLTGDLDQGAPTGNKWRGRLKDRGLTDADVDLLTECFEPRVDRPQSARVLVAELQKLAPRPKEPVERTPTSVPLGPGGPSYDTLPVTSAPGATRSDALRALTLPTRGADAAPLAGVIRLRPGTKAGERTVINSLGLEIPFRWCPPGKFKMGSPTSEANRSIDENQVDVELTHGFWLGETVVTQELFRAVLNADPSRCKGPQRPVEQVSWEEAQAFCQKLTHQLRNEGSLAPDWRGGLPTEARWEYACRAGPTTGYFFENDATRNDASLLGQFAWFDGNANQETHPVGTREANPWGLRDMHGNVWEWCHDWYGDKLVGGTNPGGPSAGSYRVFRGGCWDDSAGFCRSAYRNGRGPSYRSDDLGFRLCLSSD